MKKIIILALISILCLCMFTGITTVCFAEEVQPDIIENTQIEENTDISEGTSSSNGGINVDNLPTTDEVIDNMTSGTNIAEEDKQLIKDMVNKLKEYTSQSDSFFVRYILPLIIAAALCVLLGLFLILPYFRKNAEIKTLKSMCKTAKEQYTEAKEQLEKYKNEIDTEKIQKDIQQFVKKELDSIGTMIETKLTNNGVEIDKMETILSSLLRGALNAWKASPEAVACLTESASATELKNVVEKNAKLTAYIYQKFGAEAGKEISSL